MTLDYYCQNQLEKRHSEIALSAIQLLIFGILYPIHSVILNLFPNSRQTLKLSSFEKLIYTYRPYIDTYNWIHINTSRPSKILN